MARSMCPTCGRAHAAPRKAKTTGRAAGVGFLTAAEQAELSTDEFYKYRAAVAPLGDVEFYLRALVAEPMGEAERAAYQAAAKLRDELMTRKARPADRAALYAIQRTTRKHPGRPFRYDIARNAADDAAGYRDELAAELTGELDVTIGALVAGHEAAL